MTAMHLCRAGTALIVITLALTAAQPPHAQKQKQHSITGQIFDALSNSPVTDVDLELSTNKWEFVDAITPDSQGRFSFRGLAPGEYVLGASRLDFGTIYYAELPDPGWMQTIHVGTDDEEKQVVFKLFPRASVSGTVRDESGDPLPAISVTLSRSIWNDGRVTLRPMNQGQTDDRGQFKINNVVSGTYIPCAMPNGSRLAALSSDIDFAARGPERYYSRSCGPALEITPGQRVSADLTLTAAAAVRVFGHVANAAPNLGWNIRLIRDEPGLLDPPLFPLFLAPDKGTFETQGVPPGNYRLEADFTGQTAQGETIGLTARLPVAVGNTDVDGIELTLEPMARIEVAVNGPAGAKQELPSVMVGLRSSNHAEVLWAEFPHAGWRNLAPDIYTLITRSNESVCVQSAKLGDKELLHGSVTVTAGMTGRIEVTASNSCGSVKGNVVENDRAIPNAKVLLLLSGSEADPGDLVTTFTDEQGEYVFQGLPFGRYELWAWTVSQDGSFVGPSKLAGGTRAVVNNTEPVHLDLPLLKSEGAAK